jgi:hypothetical protein
MKRSKGEMLCEKDLLRSLFLCEEHFPRLLGFPRVGVPSEKGNHLKLGVNVVIIADLGRGVSV